MISANYHTHTVRCQHAEGTEREYVEAAIKHGYKVLGFSDHTPQPFDTGFVSDIRMRMDQFDDYVDTVKALKKEYEGRIEIKLGLEVEYYPRYFESLLKEADSRGIEYMILGQHFVPEEETGFYSGSRTDSESDLAAYVDQVTEALETGRFMYLAHPDLIHYTGDDRVYFRHMERLCGYAVDHDIPLEVNGLGMVTGRWYPREDFFRFAASMGCRFVFGCDAHIPAQVIQPEEIRGFDGFLAETNVTFNPSICA